MRRRAERGSIVTGQIVTEGKAQRAAQFRRNPTETEALLWDQLRANRRSGLHFRRQQVIDGFIVDFYCHTAQVVVEIDGPIHENQQAYDRERDRIIAGRNLRILRVTDEDVLYQLGDVLDRIVNLCRRPTPQPPP